MDKELTPEQIAKIKAAKRRRKEKKERADEAWRRQQDAIRSQIAEARARRKIFLFWLLMAMLMTQIAANLFIPRPIYRPDPAPKPPRRKEKRQKKPERNKENKEKWKPSPESDFAPKSGEDDYCDGYSRADWERMADEKGWRPGSKLAQKRAWENDPQRSLFPERYQGWDHRPSLWELLREFSDRHQNSVAFKALLIVAPVEARTWLQEANTLDPGHIRRAFAKTSPEIAENMKTAAVIWEVQKAKEAADALREAKIAKKANGTDEDDDSNWER